MDSRLGRIPRPAALGLATALVVGLTLAGCGGGGGGGGTSSGGPFGGSATGSATGSPTGAATGTAPAAGATASATVNGALKLGDSATVSFEQAGQHTTVRVATLSVTKGKIADFADYQLTAQQRTNVPYYVRATFANLGSQTLKKPGMTKLLFAFAQDGSRATPVTAPGFRLCNPGEPDAWGPGGLLTECATYLVPARSAVTTVTFQANNHQDAVVWKTS